MLKIKQVRDIDDNLWRQFIGYCRMKNVKVGDQINNMLNEFLKKKVVLK